MLHAWGAFAHHLAAFTLFACVLIEHLMLKPDLTLTGAKRLLRIDMVYGISAMLVLIIGIARVTHLEKGWAYYSQNGFFWIKMSAFALVALLSIYPTVTFISWRKPLQQNILPPVTGPRVKRVVWCLRLQLLFLVIMLGAAAMMARGIGML
jgi:putative membrane protein